jgi:signal transduction histidine kinase
LLALGRLKAGREGIVATQFDLAALSGDLEQQATVLNADRGLRLTWKRRRPPTSWSTIADKIRTIAYHLVNNAIKFTPAGRVEVIWEARADGTLVLTVRDTGIGFPEEGAPVIFEDFRPARRLARRGATRAPGSDSRIVRRLNRAPRRHAPLESAPAQGTTSSSTLPPHAEVTGLCALTAESAVTTCAAGLVEHEPVEPMLGHGADELVEVDRLHDVAVDAEVVALDDVALLARRGHQTTGRGG